MKTILKPLAIAAISIATLTSAKAEDAVYKFRGVVCRPYSSALSVFKEWGEEPGPNWFAPYVDADLWRTQMDYKSPFGLAATTWWQDTKKIPDRDCTWANYLSGKSDLLPVTKVNAQAPGLPSGTAAICVSAYAWLDRKMTKYGKDAGDANCGYWAIVRPERTFRNFNIPVNKQ